jgi:hypothetical protein
MNKQFLKILLLTAALYAQNALYSNPSWEMVEDIFITKPEKELTSFTNRFFRWGLAGLGGVGGYLGTRKFCTYMAYNSPVVPRVNIPVVPAVGAGTSALLTYALVTEISRQSIERRIIRNFIASWPEKKGNTPSELHSLLEKLYERFTKDSASFDEEAGDTMRAIRSAVYNHFPQKYRDITNNNTSTLKLLTTNVHFNFDLGSVLKAIADFTKIFYRPAHHARGK